MEKLIMDWGAFLDINLFYDAIEFFKGGKDEILKNVQIHSKNRSLGSQKVHLLSPDVAFKISSIKKDVQKYETHLHKFLHCSPLKAIQWINFKNNQINFKTILK